MGKWIHFLGFFLHDATSPSIEPATLMLFDHCWPDRRPVAFDGRYGHIHGIIYAISVHTKLRRNCLTNPKQLMGKNFSGLDVKKWIKKKLRIVDQSSATQCMVATTTSTVRFTQRFMIVRPIQCPRI
jgi:hypothetical protein